MDPLTTELIAKRPESVVRRGSEAFLDIDAALELITEAERRGCAVLGLEGFLVDDSSVYPALSRIADFSSMAASDAAAAARGLLEGPWASPPTEADQMSCEALGRHMVAVVLQEL